MIILRKKRVFANFVKVMKKTHQGFNSHIVAAKQRRFIRLKADEVLIKGGLAWQ